MLNFLRKLRRSNMNGKYLKYAFGEILLVVAGILIALQINLWAQKKKDRIREQVILKSLLAEIDNNDITLDETISANLLNKSSAERIAKHTGIENSTMTEKEFAKLFGSAFKHEIAYTPGNGVLKELINTGNLSLIKNQTLRTTLSSWGAKLQRLYYQQLQVEKIRQKIYDIIMDTGNFRKLLDVTREDEPWYQLSDSQFLQGNISLLSSPQFENNLVLFIGSSTYLDFSFYQEHKIKLQELRTLVSNQIKD